MVTIGNQRFSHWVVCDVGARYLMQETMEWCWVVNCGRSDRWRYAGGGGRELFDKIAHSKLSVVLLVGIVARCCLN